MFLEDNQASAIMKFRENTGGEILGMTRFLERLDDWPVLHYAVYLLEKGYIDKYLMLLYAHACHHGRTDLMCYYEQVTANGEVFLDDCIPSLLTVPIMTARMFVYEKIKDRTLVLLSGVPKSWLTKGCSVVGVGTSFGKVSVAVKDRCITVEFEEPLAKQAELVWRLKETLKEKDIIEGMEAVEKIEGNRIILKKGITCAKLEIGNNA